MKNKKTLWMILTGLVIGAISVILVANGNPKNMGFCIACFIRDTVGAVGMHQAGVVQYVRPEIIGLVLGALLMSVAGKEFSAKGGSAPFTRFILGFFVMIGALMFLGCPLRMVLRIAGGDLNAVVGLVGFVVGILVGIWFLTKGFSLKRAHDQSKLEGLAISGVQIFLLVLLVAAPGILLFSKEGPGSMHAPIWMALIAGLVVGALAQKTRLCMVGGIRDAVLFKDFYLLYGFLAIIVAALIGNLITGNFHLGFMINAETPQPIAHTDGLWNALGMVLVGFASVLLGGCPLRQLILAGSGNGDSAVTVMGLAVGAAFCHNFKLAASGAGPTPNGKIAVVIGLIITAVIGLMNLQKQKD
ncbi:YedE family putative selenium transporter [Acidaminobacterium chupaoyuni]